MSVILFVSTYVSTRSRRTIKNLQKPTRSRVRSVVGCQDCYGRKVGTVGSGYRYLLPDQCLCGDCEFRVSTLGFDNSAAFIVLHPGLFSPQPPTFSHTDADFTVLDMSLNGSQILVPINFDLPFQFRQEDILEYRPVFHQNNCPGANPANEPPMTLIRLPQKTRLELLLPAAVAKGRRTSCQVTIILDGSSRCFKKLVTSIYLHITVNCARVKGLACPKRKKPYCLRKDELNIQPLPGLPGQSSAVRLSWTMPEKYGRPTKSYTLRWGRVEFQSFGDEFAAISGAVGLPELVPVLVESEAQDVPILDTVRVQFSSLSARPRTLLGRQSSCCYAGLLSETCLQAANETMVEGLELDVVYGFILCGIYSRANKRIPPAHSAHLFLVRPSTLSLFLPCHHCCPVQTKCEESNGVTRCRDPLAAAAPPTVTFDQGYCSNLSQLSRSHKLVQSPSGPSRRHSSTDSCTLSRTRARTALSRSSSAGVSP